MPALLSTTPAGMPPLGERQELHRRMKSAAEHLSLPFRAHAWRGHAGSWLGVGAGSSIDFQDHRPYLPGDDPRYIDWRAYARTGHYIMKMYREEVSPLLDLVLDSSASMFFEPDKARRALELFAFCVESARRSGAAVRAFLAAGGEIRAVALEQVLAEPEALLAAGNVAPDLSRIPWRSGSMRVLISDLLFAGGPDAILSSLAGSRGRGLILAPHCAAETAPDWGGNLEFTDCESRARRVQFVSPDLLGRYAEAYGRHFALWRERARRHGVQLGRIPSEPPFRQALQSEALPLGVVVLN